MLSSVFLLWDLLTVLLTAPQIHLQCFVCLTTVCWHPVAHPSWAKSHQPVQSVSKPSSTQPPSVAPVAGAVVSVDVEDLRAEVTHMVKEGQSVAVRCTYYARTIENPDEELAISHFMAIWEVSDSKIVKGSMMSQPASAPNWQPV